MDGVLVAYHNTAKMFGFQYIPLEEMEARLYGSTPGAGDRVFQKCVVLMELIVDEVARCFPNEVMSSYLHLLEWAKVDNAGRLVGEMHVGIARRQGSTQHLGSAGKLGTGRRGRASAA